MDDETIKAIVDEIMPLLRGRLPGKLFQLTAGSLAIDFRLHGSRYLLVMVEPSQPRLHLIERRLRDLEKASRSPSPFALQLKKELSGLPLAAIEKDPADRIVHFVFVGRDELGVERTRMLIAQLTGRASNLLLLDEKQVILGSMLITRGPGQAIGEEYQPPAAARSHGDRVTSPTVKRARSRVSSPTGSESGMRVSSPTVREGSAHETSLSAALDAHYSTLALNQVFDSQAATARARLQKDLARARKLKLKLESDLASHADADQQKRLGDLLLANLSTAKRRGGRVKLIDYFDERAPTIEIEVDENSTLQEEAARRFAAYSRSKRAVEKIKERTAGVTRELADLSARKERLEAIIVSRDEAALADLTGINAPSKSSSPKRKPLKRIPGTRRYLSSDGYEILVGRAARDNDNLTFKVARPNDLWLHAADYPGSHVVVRNSTRKEIPHRTIIEAAQLAGYFSDARKDSKVTVRYTQRKFLSKPKGAAPGLVRLSRFKSIAVEPRETPERIP